MHKSPTVYSTHSHSDNLLPCLLAHSTPAVLGSLLSPKHTSTLLLHSLCWKILPLDIYMAHSPPPTFKSLLQCLLPNETHPVYPILNCHQILDPTLELLFCLILVCIFLLFYHIIYVLCLLFIAFLPLLKSKPLWV